MVFSVVHISTRAESIYLCFGTVIVLFGVTSKRQTTIQKADTSQKQYIRNKHFVDTHISYPCYNINSRKCLIMGKKLIRHKKL